MEKNDSKTILSKEDIAKVRFLREKLITFLKSEFKLSIVDDFKASIAGKKFEEYNIEVTFKNNQNNITNIVKSVETHFTTPGIVTKSTRNWMKVDFKNAVSRMTKKQPENLEKRDHENNVGQKEKRSTFLGDIRTILESIISIDELSKQAVLHKKEGRSDVAEIKIGKDIASAVMYTLEARGYKVFLIGSSVICTTHQSLYFETLPLYKKISTELVKMHNWIKDVDSWTSEQKINARIDIHPVLIVQSNYTDEIPFKCDSPGIATMFEKGMLFNNIESRRTGKMVYVTLNSINVAKPFIKIKIDRSSGGLVVKEGLRGEGVKYVHSTFEYDSLHLLPFNRKIDMDHVAEIGKSIDEFGIIDFVKVVETNCVDGVMKKWIVDGQHTYFSEKKRNLPILYVLIRVDSLGELVRLIAVLNNRRKPWKSKDYLHAWDSLNIPVYKNVLEWTSSKKLGFSLVLEALGGKDPKAASLLFKDGNFRAEPGDKGVTLLEKIYDLKPLLPRSMRIQVGVMRFIRSIYDTYNHEKLKSLLKQKKVTFEADETVPGVIGKITQLYNGSV